MVHVGAGVSVQALAAADYARALIRASTAGTPPPAPDAADATLVVAEVFGPTLQGEGPSTGRRAAFIRLGGCNLHCTWCDTPYTWDAARHDLRAELQRVPVPAILHDVAVMDVPLAVVTGGEPLLHQTQPGWGLLLEGLGQLGVAVEVETNGTQTPNRPTQAHVTRFNVSPKLGHADGGRDPLERRVVPEALAAFAKLARVHDGAAFKFVAQGPGDLDEIGALVTRHHIPREAVWVMPEGTTVDAILAGQRLLADPVIGRGWNLTTRLHTLLWGSERAR